MEVHHHSHTERKKWTHYLWNINERLVPVTLKDATIFLNALQKEYHIQ